MKYLAIVLTAFAIANGQASASLKDAYEGSFRIGAALNPAQFEDRDQRGNPLIAAHFNTISPENALKWQSVHPRQDSYDFRQADEYVAFGEKHGMFIVGHTLVWHSQTPQWVFQNADGKPLARDLLLERMRDHILTVVGRYKGRIGGWDVVNEALNDDGSLRQSLWRRIIGDDYILRAFEFAHEADPNAQLYYNDYSLENDAKRRGALELIRKLKEAGAPITGVGLQGHMKLDQPDASQEAKTVEEFAALGIRVNISELDVDVLPRTTPGNSADVTARSEGTAQTNPYTAGLPDPIQKALAERYSELFKVFLDNRKFIDRVTFWGVTDGDSWLNGFPIRGRTNYPLLFDREGKPKPAFDAVIGESRK
jgi:endo-1,4-beta-xylanase